jgi:6,7-dimethyl-8-ribityllumazine synthase
MTMADVKRIAGSDSAPDDARFGIIASRFNDEIVTRLVEGCVETLNERGVANKRITLVRVPGAYEIAFAARRMAMSGDFDALIALGAVIRGETAHFDYIAGECARGVSEVSADLDIPIAFGVLTTENDEQAAARAGGSMGNKGSEAALVAIEMINLIRELTK